MGNFIKKKYNSGMTNIASYLDHTLLRPDSTESDINKLCVEANEYGVASVCVAPSWVPTCHEIVKRPITTVIGFPHGNTTVFAKSMEMEQAFKKGAREMDVVINVGKVKSGTWDFIEKEIDYLVQMKRLVSMGEFTLKYIVEIGYLTDDELFRIADLLIKYKVDFIKTCTGYGPRGVTVEDIAKIKKHVGDRIKIKASGGIKTYEFCKQLIDAGADRIGCSNSINIIKESSNGGQRTELGSNPVAY